MESKKMMASFAILMIALSVAGVAYAAWYDYVYIEVTAHMGELIVGWYNTTDYRFTWYETTNGVPEDQFRPAKPWVANATLTLSNATTSVHHVPTQTVYHNLDVLLNNSYPQWDVHIEGWLKNAGTIPAILVDLTINGRDVTDDEDLTITDIWHWNATLGAWIIDGEIWDESGHLLMNIVFVAYFPEDLQLEPCNEYFLTIDLDFKQTAEECHTYTFSVGIVAIQWNKAWEYPD